MIYSNIFQAQPTVYLSLEEFPTITEAFGEDTQSISGDIVEEELAATKVGDLTTIEKQLLDFLQDGGREYLFVFEY